MADLFNSRNITSLNH